MELNLWLEKALLKIENTPAESLIQNLQSYGLVEPLASTGCVVGHYSETYSSDYKDKPIETSVMTPHYYRVSVDRFYTQTLLNAVSVFNDTMQVVDCRLCEAA